MASDIGKMLHTLEEMARELFISENRLREIRTEVKNSPVRVNRKAVARSRAATIKMLRARRSRRGRPVPRRKSSSKG